MKNHYGKDYYQWQKKSGELGVAIDLWQYKKFIKPDCTVLDFGCGGGYILEKLPGKEKYGIDINPVARREAARRGIKIYEDINALPKNLKFDVIISHHTLEHLENPAEILRKLKLKLKPHGISVHVVPINDWRNDKRYDPDDINKHLYTWTPLLLGNLFVHCGYKVERIDILTHAWLPLSKYMLKILPGFLYHFGCVVWSFITRNRQIRIVSYI